MTDPIATVLLVQVGVLSGVMIWLCLERDRIVDRLKALERKTDSTRPQIDRNEP